MPVPDDRQDPSTSARTTIAMIAVSLAAAALLVGVLTHGQVDQGPRVFDLVPGERRYWEPGQVQRGDLMRCHGAIYALRDGSVDTVDATGVSVGHATDGSVIATCPKRLDLGSG